MIPMHPRWISSLLLKHTVRSCLKSTLYTWSVEVRDLTPPQQFIYPRSRDLWISALMTNTIFANPDCLHSLLRSSMPEGMTRIEDMVALPSRHCIYPLWDPPFSPNLCSHFRNYWSERWSSCLRRSISLLRPVHSPFIPQWGTWSPG